MVSFALRKPFLKYLEITIATDTAPNQASTIKVTKRITQQHCINVQKQILQLQLVSMNFITTLLYIMSYNCVLKNITV